MLVSYGPQNQCYNEVPVYIWNNRLEVVGWMNLKNSECTIGV